MVLFNVQFYIFTWKNRKTANHLSVLSLLPYFPAILSIMDTPMADLATVIVPTAELDVNMSGVTPKPFGTRRCNGH